MDAALPNRLSLGDLSSLARRVALDPAPAEIVARCASVPEALDQLAASGFLVEATTLVAHALPRREAVWWACMCARHTAPPTLPESDRIAERAARSWATRPRGAMSRQALRPAELAGLSTPEAWAAVAALWGESEEGTGPTPAYLTAVAVAGAVGLAAVRGRPQCRTERLRRFLASAREISLGGKGRLPLEA